MTAARAERKARHVDPDSRMAALNRLKRIEGQVRGLQRMVENGRWCGDILTQISSVEMALSGVSKLLLENHLRHCVAHTVKSGSAEETERVYAELVDLLAKHWR
jgi:DNA-binding FrmR family transcriptional regulator